MSVTDLLYDFSDYWNDLLVNRSDPRVKDWFLMQSPVPTLVMIVLYVLIVKKIGPKFMENRKPFQLKKTLILYNAFQVAYSSWLFYYACTLGWFTFYSYRCQPVDYSMNPIAVRTAEICWWYYFAKFTEFFDTFFFVLRKKNDHISTLHVVHHGFMPIGTWFGVKFVAGGNSTFFGLLNTFVHIIMYSYYMFAAMGPQFQKYLWWKKYLTVLQMVQFLLVMIHSGQLFFIDCDYPKVFGLVCLFVAFMFYGLFSDFYKKHYKRRPKPDQKNGIAKKTNINNNFGLCYSNQDALNEPTTSKENGYEKKENGYEKKENDYEKEENWDKANDATRKRIRQTMEGTYGY